MSKIEKTVFISYRRTNVGFALAVYQNLKLQGYDVFFDFTGINSGDFEQNIVENIKSRAHFVVLLTPSALDRVHEPGDWLRREIETAIDYRRNIVPLTFEGFDWSEARDKYLTGKLTVLSNYNALRIPVDYFEEAIQKLCSRYLQTPLDMVLHPASQRAEEIVASQKLQADKAPAVQEKVLTAEELFERGILKQNQGDKTAAADYNEALRLTPNFAEAFNNRGLLKYNLGDFAGAVADYNEALRLKPDYAEAFNNRGLVKYKSSDYMGAIADYNEAVRLKPDYVEAYNNRGLVMYSFGDYVAALAEYNEAIRLKPEFAHAYNNRGLVKSIQGDHAGAVTDYNEAIRLKPDYAEAYNNRGLILYNFGNNAGAIADYTEAIRLVPDFALAYFNRGLAKYNRRDYAGAVLDYEAFLELQPDNANARLSLELARRKLEEWTQNNP